MRKERHFVYLGVADPPLLPAEQAESTTLKLRELPPELAPEDVMVIRNLVGRIPGLPHREISMIEESRFGEGSFDVWVLPYVIRMKRDPEWRVVRIRMPRF